MRKSLNLLQSLFMINGSNNIITLNSVYKSIGFPTDDEREEIIKSISDKSLTKTYQILNKLETENNLSNQDIIREISLHYGKTYLQNIKEIKKQKGKNIILTQKEQNKLLNLFDELSKIEINISNNTNSNIQLLAISSVINNYNK